MNNQLEFKLNAPSILKFVLPSIIMMVIMSLYTVVDGIFVSNLIGTDAFSAVNIIYPLLGITIGLGTMFGTGITAIVTIKLGEGKQKEANENFTFIIGFTIALGFLISIIAFYFLEDIIYVLGANDTIYKYCYEYAFPLVFFFSANILQFQFQNLYIANGKPHIGLIMTTIGGVTNMILDYVFIVNFNMGISGAAIATGIGYSIPAIYGLCYFSLNQKNVLHFVKPKMDMRVLWHTMGNGSSEMVSYLSASCTTFLFNNIMIRLAGPDGVAAIAILLYLDFILVAICMGYSIGIAPLFSFNFGRKNKEHLKLLFRISMRFCLIVGCVMCMGTFLFKEPLIALFTHSDSTVYSFAVNGLAIYACSYLFKGLSIFSSAMFTAFGNGKVSAVLSFMRTLVFVTSTLLIFAYLFGIDGVWVATPVAECLAFMMSIFFIFKYRFNYEYMRINF